MKYVASAGEDAKRVYKDLENFFCAGTRDENLL
jgi:hypothetical protein